MNKHTDFPEQPRHISSEEGEGMFQNVIKQIKEYAPDEIIQVTRSGCSYGSWASQILDLPLGTYYPKKPLIIFDSDNPKKVVFVDDNTVKGETYEDVKEFMAKNYPNVEYKWAVLFSDWHTPESVRNEIIQGARLPYFAEEPIWGSRKISKAPGVRHRDE